MGFERQFLADALIQQVQQVRTGSLEAGCEFAGRGGAADLVCRFQYRHLATRLGQVGCAYQSVVAAADNDYMIRISHPTSPPEPCSVFLYLSVFPAPRWRPAPP